MFKNIYIISFFFIFSTYAMDTSQNVEIKGINFLNFGEFAIQIPHEIFSHIAEYLSFFEMMHLKRLNKVCKEFWHEETRKLSFDEATFVLTHFAEKNNKEKFKYFWEKNEPERRLRAVRLRCLHNNISLGTKMEVYQNGCLIPVQRQERIIKDDFAQALRMRDIDLMKTMFIGTQFPLFAKNRKEKKHLALICKIKDFSLFKLFLDGKDRINETDEWNESVLHYAVTYGTVEMVKYLLENGVKNIQDYKGNYPLHYAAQSGKSSMIDLLGRYGADVNVKNEDKETPLHRAARFGRYKSVQVLLNQKDINKEARDILMQTPLHVAALYGCLRSAQVLIKDGVSLKSRDCKYRTPLHNACMKGKFEVAKKLIEAGANVNVNDIDGKTPLDLIRSVKNKDDKIQLKLRNLLIESGADLVVIDDHEKMVTTID